MRSFRSSIVAVLVAGALALVAAPAAACCGAGASDPNDVAGKLDLAHVQWSKSPGSGPLSITVRTYGTWTKSVLHGNANRLVVYLDTDRDGTIDYHARVKESGGKLYAVIAGSGSSFEPLPAHKPNGRTVRFTIPGNSPPNPNGTGPQIRAYSKFTQSVQCDTASGHPPCIDRAPNTGWI